MVHWSSRERHGQLQSSGRMCYLNQLVLNSTMCVKNTPACAAEVQAAGTMLSRYLHQILYFLCECCSRKRDSSDQTSSSLLLSNLVKPVYIVTSGYRRGTCCGPETWTSSATAARLLQGLTVSHSFIQTLVLWTWTLNPRDDCPWK